MAIWSKRSNIKKTNLVKAKSKVGHYHCVELVLRYDACDVAMQQSGKRYLSDEAPMIPLPGCDQQNCRCRYRHHEDRRHEERRDPFSVSGIHTMFSEQNNRRLGGDRRRNTYTKVAI